MHPLVLGWKENNRAAYNNKSELSVSVTHASGMGGLLTSDPLKQIQAFVVQAFHGHLGPPKAEFTDHLIERRHATLIPDMG